MPAIREVHADLVGPARLQHHVDAGMRAESFHDRVVRHRRPAGIAHGHSRAIDRVAADSRVNPAAAGQHPVADGQVLPRYRALGERPDQRGMGRQ